MKVTLRWLQHFVEIPDDPGAVAAALQSLGHEVESVETITAPFSGVVVGRVEEIAPHPNADKIRLCRVDTGGEVRSIVCGAWNFDAGATVPVALPGSVLAGGFEITRRTIRGVESDGMICSESELGLGPDAAGIMVLEGDGPPGTDFATTLPFPDTVFDVSITPNRPDCMSVLGLARDLGAFFERPVRFAAPVIEAAGPDGAVEIRIDDAAGCPRYVGRVVRDVAVGPSPLWMRLRLQAAGHRPINNVVDASNYVLAAFGHPTHAFDLDRLGTTVVVRRAREGEALRTLDGVDRTLHSEDLVIADATRPVALAGVMGGEDTEVSEGTRHVLIESAYFHPPSVMLTSKRHGLRSDASSRFERGMDPGFAPIAADLVADLLARFAGGAVTGNAVDAYPKRIEPGSVELPLAEVRRVLGIDLGRERITALLQRLGFAVTGEDPLRVGVPTRRPDVTRPVDLIEEIARLHGYDAIPETLVTGTGGGLPERERRLRRLRSVMAGAGYREALLFSFIGEDDFDALGLAADDPRRAWIRVTNPLRDEQGVLRTTLLPGLLRAAGVNRSRHAGDVAIFEVGKVFVRGGGAIPDQPDRLAFVACGEHGLAWDGSRQGYDVYDATGVWELIADALRMPDWELEADGTAPFHPGRAAAVTIAGRAAGTVGEIRPEVAAGFGLEGRVIAGELDLDAVLGGSKDWSFRAPSPFPPVIFDLAFEVAAATPAAGVEATIAAAAGPMLEHIETFDVFVGAPVPEGSKSLAFRLTFRAPGRTLQDEELAPIRAEISAAVAAAVGGKLRGAG